MNNHLNRLCTVLEQGGVLLLKGVGGYQLMCRSDSEGAVERLRSIKHRTKKSVRSNGFVMLRKH